jgi:crossover junction endodeoxyribonuclease RuvC
VRSEPRIILGLDPGIGLLGYGVIDVRGDEMRHLDHGCIATSSTQSVPTRLRVLFDGLTHVRARFGITDVAVETLFYSRNVTTAVAVGQARGVALLATVDETTTFGEYAPAEIKQIVGGFGAARKREMQEMVRLLLDLERVPSPDDAADALAVAICHARRSQFSSLLAASGATQAR